MEKTEAVDVREDARAVLVVPRTRRIYKDAAYGKRLLLTL
jgi:hypothetical protein